MHKVLKILISSSFVISFSAGLLGPIYAIFVERIGGDILAAGIAWAIYSIVLGVLVIIFGKIEDRLDWRKMLIIGRFINILGIGGYFFVQNPIQLFLVQAFLGIAEAIKNPAWDALFSRNIDKGRETSEWATFEGLDYISVGIAAVLGSFVAAVLGFKALFVLMLFSAIIAFLITLFILRKPFLEVLKV